MKATDLPPDFCQTQWPQALALAQHACGRSLARLRRGEGGFYDAQDFVQDLYCAWAALCVTHGANDAALWHAWRGLLYAGGRQILRRPPQRLWQRPDMCLPMPALERAQDQPPRHNADDLHRWRQVSQALWQLPIAQRQIITMRTLHGLSSRQVAARLGLQSASVDARLRRARVRLARMVNHTKENGR